MMSQTSLESKLEALQCHFTWDLDYSGPKLSRVRDKLEDIGTEEGNSWLGHIYNLRGYVQYKLGFTEDAQSFFNKAAEAFCQTGRADSDEGPWSVVNYGNLAWLHHHLGEQAESQAYLSKVDALMNKYPSPSQDELHPEIYAERAWTLMKFSADKKQLAADYFQRAIRMQPDMVEWKTSHVLVLYSVLMSDNKKVDDDMLEKMRIAKEEDPENLYLAAHYLQECAKKGERVKDEARELAEKILRNPVSSYSGVRPLLWLYIHFVSVDEAINLAEEALRHHPDVRYLKRCLALCYKSKIYRGEDGRRDQSMIDKAVGLHEEVVSLYCQASLLRRTDLANLHANSYHGQAKAKKIYQELLESELEPPDRQLVYNQYAKYLFYVRHDHQGSIQYHMKAAEITHKSRFRENSIQVLRKRSRNSMCRCAMCREIEQFLENLQEPSCF